MRSIGRNDPCPCGSGKKYKKCHLDKELPQEIIEARSKTTMKPITSTKISFQTLLTEYQTLQTVLTIGLLQLHPSNHGKNIHLEQMARDCLRVLKKNDSLKPPAWSELKEAISTSGAGNYYETPWNSFTGNIIYRNGNNIVYPGIYNHGSQILNEIIIALSLIENGLPEQFKATVLNGVALLLQLSDFVARSQKHPRYMNFRNESKIIEFPSYEEGLKTIESLTFTQEEVQAICKPIDINPEVLNYFFIDLDSNELRNDDPEDNVVIKKPFLKINETIYLYMPTAIVSSLVDFAFEQALHYGCKEEFFKVIQKTQKDIVLQSIERMGWKGISISLPEDPLKLTTSEFLCQFDNKKIAYVCFLNNGYSQSEEAKTVEDPLAIRNKQIVDYLVGRDSNTEVLTLYVSPDLGMNLMWRWGRPIKGNYTLMFRVHELELISNQNGVNSLSLWKFAKALHRAGEKIKLMCPSMIELFGYYDDNDGSLLDANEVNQGIVHVSGEYAAKMFIEFEIKHDHHAIMTKMNGQLGFIHIHRHRAYAPIYIPDSYEDFVLIVKSFSTPVWIRNNQKAPKNVRNWGYDIAEAIAFWLIRLSGSLAYYFNEQRYLQYDIEVEIDIQLLEGRDFAIPDELPENVDLPLEVTSDLVRITIPFEFGLLVWRHDNVADKTLIKTVIGGIIQCSGLRGKIVEITDEELDRIIDETLIPYNAKMLLFNNAYHDPRLDVRNLASFNTIHKADTAQVLDDLISYMPSGYFIPDDIPTREQKLTVVDDIIGSLLREIKLRLSEYDGDKLIQFLIHLNEACTQKKEFLEILRPPRIACFSSFSEEVEKILDENNDLVSTGHALRTLVEFTGTNLPKGKKEPGYDNVGELMAFVDQLMAMGYLREVLENNLAEPKMGKLPSGRLGVDKDIYRKVFEPLHQARAQGKILAELERFDTKYTESQGKIGSAKKSNAELNAALVDELGFSFDHLYAVVHVLTEEGFKKGQAVIILRETYLIEKLIAGIIGMDSVIAKHILDFLSLPNRSNIVFSKNEKNEYDKQFVPWRFNRSFSYLMKPLVKGKDSEGNDCLYYGYRHLSVSVHHYLYLIYNAKFPSPNSIKMKSFLGSIAGNLGKPFEIEVRDWLKNNTSFEVHPEEVYPNKKLGDIDVFAVDHTKKIIYSIECKNTRGAKNVIEMVGEMNAFLGREDVGEKPKILKHFERDQWLRANMESLNSLVPNAKTYKIKSIVLTADELSIEYLGGSKLLLPVLAFSKLKLNGIGSLEEL